MSMVISGFEKLKTEYESCPDFCDIYIKFKFNAPIPRYGDVTVTYIRRSEIPLRIYAKHQYKQGSEYDKA